MAVTTMLNPAAPEFQMPRPFNPQAAEFIPMAGGWAQLQAATEALQFQQKQKRAMPFATEEEWRQRIAKREKEVETIKSLQSYRLYIEVFPHDKRGHDEPKTPDPRDRTVSKRTWKWNVERWRLQLKSRCVYSRSVMLQCRELVASPRLGTIALRSEVDAGDCQQGDDAAADSLRAWQDRMQIWRQALASWKTGRAYSRAVMLQIRESGLHDTADLEDSSSSTGPSMRHLRSMSIEHLLSATTALAANLQDSGAGVATAAEKERARVPPPAAAAPSPPAAQLQPSTPGAAAGSFQ